MWSAWDNPRLGHLRLPVRNEAVGDDGLVLGVTEGRPFRVAYQVRCDTGWRVRAARVGVPDPEPLGVDPLSDGEGNWTTPDGRAVPELEGCVDMDISTTIQKYKTISPAVSRSAKGERHAAARVG
jgi:hypothetical protein